MTAVVILQPQFLPWYGVFEQVRLTDIYVHLDDVQLPQGRSFCTRVQIKTPVGRKWLTVPVRHNSSQLIKDVTIVEKPRWRERALDTLRHSLARTPYGSWVETLTSELLDSRHRLLSDLNTFAIERISAELKFDREFLRSSTMSTKTCGSEKILSIAMQLGADRYITGHGALNYLDHELFERNGIRVEYIQYDLEPYPQKFMPFDPRVTILDLLAYTGTQAVSHMKSRLVYWREFLDERL